jgi:hypothetical protein
MDSEPTKILSLLNLLCKVGQYGDPPRLRHEVMQDTGRNGTLARFPAAQIGFASRVPAAMAATKPMSAEACLKELGLVLPALPKPVANLATLSTRRKPLVPRRPRPAR